MTETRTSPATSRTRKTHKLPKTRIRLSDEQRYCHLLPGSLRRELKLGLLIWLDQAVPLKKAARILGVSSKDAQRLTLEHGELFTPRADGFLVRELLDLKERLENA